MFSIGGPEGQSPCATELEITAEDSTWRVLIVLTSLY